MSLKKLTLLGKYVLGNRSFSLTIEKQTKSNSYLTETNDPSYHPYHFKKCTQYYIRVKQLNT